jgi:hypothetical protein
MVSVFFVVTSTTKEKEIDFSQTTICSACGAYGRYELFMTYNQLSLFFIPVIKWGRKYYVKLRCCGSLYTIDSDLGRDIERGEKTTINESDLHPVRINHRREYFCANCGYKLSSEYEYCPKCGSKV